MPQKVTNYKIFISSPGDLQEQREVVDQAIESLSKTYEHRGITIKSWRWEEQVASKLGVLPQDHVFESLGQYDIYLGLMAARFGTPTGNYGSGTEAEFEDAIARYKDQKILTAAFLFKNTSINAVSLRSNDILQLSRLVEFKERVGQLGIYSQFSENVDLALLVTEIVSTAIDKVERIEIKTQHQHDLTFPQGQIKKLQISKDFYAERLDRLENGLSNSRKLQLDLGDVWIEPQLRILNEVDPSQMPERGNYKYSELIDALCAGESKVITGIEKSGKSTICKKLFIDLFSRGKIPILLTSDKINSENLENISRRMFVSIAEQYDNIPWKSWNEVPSGDVIILLDDYERVRLAPRRSKELLKNLAVNRYTFVIVVSQAYALDSLGRHASDGAPLGLQTVEIQELGHEARYNIIERWCVAGAESFIPESDLRTSVEQKRSVIDRIFASGLVPRVPIMALILLQANESGQIPDLARAGYVRYYKFLIDSTILRGVRSQTAELAYVMLPMLAWKMFSINADFLSPQQAEAAIEEISSQKALKKSDLYDTLSQMKRVGMFFSDRMEHRFKDRYTYYYFLADFLSRNIQHNDIRVRVKELCRTISTPESSNILVFLSFHTDDNIIIENLSEGLIKLFGGAQLFELSRAHTAPANKLLSSAPRLIIDQNKFDENRQARLQAQDDFEEENKDKKFGKINKNSEEKAHKSDKDLELVLCINAIEVLGHVLRNHYARLDAAPKIFIFETVSNAALRCLGDIFEDFSVSLDDLVSAVSGLMARSERPRDSEETKEKKAKRAVFILLSAIVFFVIKSLTRAVADENLEVTYDQSMKSNENSAVRTLIDLSIRLESFREFPLDALQNVMKKIDGDQIGQFVTQLLVSERLDMRPPSNKPEIQRISSIANMPVRQTKLTAPRTKRSETDH